MNTTETTLAARIEQLESYLRLRGWCPKCCVLPMESDAIGGHFGTCRSCRMKLATADTEKATTKEIEGNLATDDWAEVRHKDFLSNVRCSMDIFGNEISEHDRGMIVRHVMMFARQEFGR